MFRSFSDTLVQGVPQTLTGTAPTAGWVVFNDSNVNTYDFQVSDPIAGTATFKIGPKETQKIQTQDSEVVISGVGVYRAICFQSLTSFRLYTASTELNATLNSDYGPDNVTIEFTGQAPQDKLQVKNGGVTLAKLDPAVQAILAKGGITIVQAGGTLSGTHDSVLCLGSASLTDNVTIRGDLYQVWDGTPVITNTGAYNLTVHGSAHLYSYDNTPTNTGAANGNVTIHGNLTFGVFKAVSTGGSSSTFSVGGNCIGHSGATSELYLNGVNNSPAATATIHGDLVCGILYGAGAGVAGAGINLVVRGDMIVATNVDGAGGTGGASGAGGVGANITVYGDLRVTGGDVILTGGSSSVGNGGAGGTLTVTGSASVDGAYSILASGGACSSTNAIRVAGNAGVITCGSLSVATLTASGGARSGTTVASQNNTGPVGGYVTVKGDLSIVTAITLNGGAITTAVDNGPGGVGGTLVVGGATRGDGTITLSGGNSNLGNGGVGGTATFYGQVLASTISLNGGNAVDAGDTNGAAGSVTFQSGVVCATLNLKDGSGAGAAPTAAASVTMAGSCFFGTIDVTARSAVDIKANADGATLSVSTLAGKKKFTNGDNSDVPAATDITPAGILFYYNGGAWYATSGSPVAP